MNSFNEHATTYDEWYDSHPQIYESELLALKKLIPSEAKERGIEIGVGTGRFALPLGVPIGIEPADSMGAIAKSRGIIVVKALAEKLPILNASMNYLLMVTVVCFLKNPISAFKEAFRVLKKQGQIIIGMINKNSELGKLYDQKKHESLFYRDAHFHTVEDIVQSLKQAGFRNFSFFQTLTIPNLKEVEIPQPGYNKGGFVVIKSQRDELE